MKQGSFNVCETCGYKVISKTHYENHLKTHVVEYPEKDIQEVVATEESKSEIQEVAPVEPTAPQVPDEITIRFIKAIEVTINGIHYSGTEIKVKNMSVASEIVRIAREAYGSQILA